MIAPQVGHVRNVQLEPGQRPYKVITLSVNPPIFGRYDRQFNRARRGNVYIFSQSRPVAVYIFFSESRPAAVYMFFFRIVTGSQVRKGPGFYNTDPSITE